MKEPKGCYKDWFESNYIIKEIPGENGKKDYRIGLIPLGCYCSVNIEIPQGFGIELEENHIGKVVHSSSGDSPDILEPSEVKVRVYGTKDFQLETMVPIMLRKIISEAYNAK